MQITPSLKYRVLSATGGVLILFLFLLALAVQEAFDETLAQSVRERLSATTNVLLTAAREHRGKLVMPKELPDERFNQVESKVSGYIFDQEGRLLWQSPSTLDHPPLYQPDYTPDETLFDLVSAPETGEYYAIYDIDLQLRPGGPGYSFVTLAPAADYEHNIRKFRRNLLFWSGLTLVGLLLILWTALWWSLRPLKRLSQQLEAVETGQRSHFDGAYPSELFRLVRGLNKLLASEQLQRERYRTTMADLAHSLKTPLAVIHGANNRLTLEPSPSSAELGELYSTTDEQVQRMNQIIGYQLQRAVIGHKALSNASVAVTPVVEKLARTLNKVYSDKQVQLQLRLDPACRFCGAEEDLLEVLGNLMENAYKLCLGKVQISGFVQAAPKQASHMSELVLSIEDDGPGVPVERRSTILQRGIRADSRSAGQGIGLAVAMDIIESYEGQLKVDDSPLGGALFQLRLPQ